MHHRTRPPRRRGFSLVELVVVVVIIAIIGAIAIPRLSRGAKGAADASLIANLAVLRNAIDHYRAEHYDRFPSLAQFKMLMTRYSDAAGDFSATPTAEYFLGPYLRAIPPLPVGAEKGSAAVTKTPGTPKKGWVYSETGGTIFANTSDAEVDDRGIKYSDY